MYSTSFGCTLDRTTILEWQFKKKKEDISLHQFEYNRQFIFNLNNTCIIVSICSMSIKPSFIFFPTLIVYFTLGYVYQYELLSIKSKDMERMTVLTVGCIFLLLQAMDTVP